MRENVQVQSNKFMPADFEKCIADGGKVITKRVNADEYIHACKDKNGKWHEGEVKQYKKLSTSNNRKK